MKKVHIKNRIRAVRERLGWTAAYLAEKVDTTEQQVCRLENGDRKLTLEWILKLCGAMNVTADELVDLPMKGINKASADPVLVDSVVGFIIEACDKADIRASKNQMDKWATQAFTAAIELDLNIHQVRGIANLLVKAGK